jgi:hypothetical protein
MSFLTAKAEKPLMKMRNSPTETVTARARMQRASKIALERSTRQIYAIALRTPRGLLK